MTVEIAPLPLEELRALAKSAGGVNTHVATYYDLRWHDPAWVASWRRWNMARAAWDQAWPTVPYAEMEDISNPSAQYIINAEHRAAAEEFLAARLAYKALTAHFLPPET